MQIEMRLQQVLKQYQLDDGRGVLKRIAAEAHIHRHTVAKVYRNEAPNVSLETIGKLCDWLRSKGVPEEVLPQALFGSRSSSLWQTLAAPGAATVYLGEYQQEARSPRLRWISRRDAFVHAKIVEVLSSPSVTRNKRLMLHTRYVPFELGAANADATDARFRNSVKRAKEAFGQMRARRGSSSVILIGSQQVNYMVEHLVADLFASTAFQIPKRKTTVPFYMAYREQDRNLPSCFGGRDGPADHRGPVMPGIWYRDKNRKWTGIEWIEDKQDAGVLITAYDPRTGSFELVVYGFSGVATAAIGEQLTRTPDRFWTKDERSSGGRKIKVYVCKIGVSSAVPDQTEQDFHVESVDVVKAYQF